VSGIVWLASYPKSGNTWLRVLLTNYLRAAGEPADINNLLGAPGASSRECFDQWTGVEGSALDANVVDRLRPQVYRCMARDADDTLFMKVHDAWARVDTGEPMFPRTSRWASSMSSATRSMWPGRVLTTGVRR
jgi:hypothetical protein